MAAAKPAPETVAQYGGQSAPGRHGRDRGRLTNRILGKVVKSSAAGDPEILIEIADNVQVRVLKATLSDARPKDAEKNGDAKSAGKE